MFNKQFFTNFGVHNFKPGILGKLFFIKPENSWLYNPLFQLFGVTFPENPRWNIGLNFFLGLSPMWKMQNANYVLRPNDSMQGKAIINFCPFKKNILSKIVFLILQKTYLCFNKLFYTNFFFQKSKNSCKMGAS